MIESDWQKISATSKVGISMSSENTSFTITEEVAAAALTAAVSEISLGEEILQPFANVSAEFFSLIYELGLFLVVYQETNEVTISELAKLMAGKSFGDAVFWVDKKILSFSKGSSDSLSIAEKRISSYLKQAADSARATDSKALSSSKPLTEPPKVSDLRYSAIFKVSADIASATDIRSMSSFKTQNDPVSSSDVRSLFSYKSVSENGYASDVRIFSIVKSLFDTTTFTDDLDGAASLLDEQNMVFFKQRTEQVSATDQRLSSFSKPTSDSASVSSSGILVMQGYCDMSYFASDYVGESRTFT